jgi:hypothetical protein
MAIGRKVTTSETKKNKFNKPNVRINIWMKVIST